jgi:hypothetical protein
MARAFRQTVFDAPLQENSLVTIIGAKRAYIAAFARLIARQDATVGKGQAA